MQVLHSAEGRQAERGPYAQCPGGISRRTITGLVSVRKLNCPMKLHDPDHTAGSAKQQNVTFIVTAAWHVLCDTPLKMLQQYVNVYNTNKTQLESLSFHQQGTKNTSTWSQSVSDKEKQSWFTLNKSQILGDHVPENSIQQGQSLQRWPWGQF